MTQNKDGPLGGKFAELVHQTLDLWHVPGLAMAVVDGDETWAEGYGMASFPATPVTPSTLFYAGSTTKAFTAAIMSLLVDDNHHHPEVQWDTPISQLIRDDFVLQDEYATNHITIEDALSHRTGLPGHDQALGGTYDGHNATVRDVVRSLRHLPLTAEPRTKYQYCNAMFIVVSHIIETLTGSWLGDLMAKHVWKPLDMTATYKNGGYLPVEWMNLDNSSGAGGVISNVLDYAKWARALMEQKTPLSKSGREAIWLPRMLMPLEEPYTGPRAYAFGWRTGVYQGQRFLEHTGGMNAFGAEIIIFPDINFSIVAFANTAGTSNCAEQALAFHLIDEKLGVPREKRFDWNRKNLAMVGKEMDRARHAPEIFYPSLPEPRIPLSAPLASYAGTYFHPGYLSMTIYLDASKSTLRADRTDMTWQERLGFKHISGEYFVVASQHEGDFGALFPDAYPAEFRIGKDGRPEALGIGWVKEMGEEKIWLTRTDAK
ncbi:MAG: hypothetical protein M1819_007278 [Sarea resinae]|nr:MAG: hypothetical protein M1819_007278 [Sarea resinae]